MLRIGILIKYFDALDNWELRIIENIKNDPTLELALLVTDSRTDVYDRKSNLKRLFKSGNVFGKVAFRIQTKLERELFFKAPQTVDKKAITEYLKTIPSIATKPVRKGFSDIFSEAEADRVKKYELDVLLRHEFNIIKGPILQGAKHGIWSFHHGDNAINRGGPAGMWEIILKQPVIGVTLQQLTPALDGGLVIDKAYFNRYWSYVKNNDLILEGSVALLFKNIAQLQRGIYAPEKSPPYHNPIYKVPKFWRMVKYIFAFYGNMIRRSFEILSSKLGTRYYCWTLFLGKGNFSEYPLAQLKPIKLPKGEFWADPFLFSYKEQDYVFFESYSYKTKLAKICCGRIQNQEIVEVVDALVSDYHLSYPMIIEEDGSIFMLPETSNNSRLEVYKCVEFPSKWELFATAFEDEIVADATYFEAKNLQRWLFVNKASGADKNCDTELFIYQVDSIALQNIVPHEQNPVLIDSRIARSGGPIFMHDGKKIRPSQNNSNGVYGYGLNLNEITKLTLEEYSESSIVSIEPNFKKKMVGVHHLHQSERGFVIDGAYKKYSSRVHK